MCVHFGTVGSLQLSCGPFCKFNNLPLSKDDHDYGINNGGNTYADRDKSKHVFLEFIDEPKVRPSDFNREALRDL